MGATGLTALTYVIVLLTTLATGEDCFQPGCFPDTVVTVECTNDEPDWILEPSGVDCGKYVSCFMNVGLQMCCPDGQHFNPSILDCDDPSNVDCDVTSEPCADTTTEPAATPTQPDFTTDTTDITDETDDDTTLDPGPTDTTDEADTTEDPPTTSEIDTTDTTDTTETDGTDDTDATDDLPTTTEGGTMEEYDLLCASQPNRVEIAYPGDCKRFIVCSNQQYVATELCPAGLHFNPILFVCDAPQYAECVDTVCQDGGLPVFEVPSNTSCSKYFICFGNAGIIRECAPGTIYNPVYGWCEVEDPENPCVTDRPPVPPEEVIAQCTSEIEFNKMRHPELCAVYYRCVNGAIVTRVCPAGLLFDEDLLQCNIEYRVSCGPEI